jgi:hypothetical protein
MFIARLTTHPVTMYSLKTSQLGDWWNFQGVEVMP